MLYMPAYVEDAVHTLASGYAWLKAVCNFIYTPEATDWSAFTTAFSSPDNVLHPFNPVAVHLFPYLPGDIKGRDMPDIVPLRPIHRRWRLRALNAAALKELTTSRLVSW